MLGFSLNPQKRIAELGEREILALAITLEEDDGRIYRDFAEGLRGDLSGFGQGVRRHGRGGERSPPDAARSVPGALRRAHPADPARGRRGLRQPQAVLADAAAWAWMRCGGGPRRWSRRRANFYREAAAAVTDASIRQAAGRPRRDRGRRTPAPRISWRSTSSPSPVRESEAKTRTAPLRAAVWSSPASPASWTAPSRPWRRCSPPPLPRHSWDAFLVGLAASIGAGICMGFAEALSDDGSITGRGHPWMRGLVCGLMTTLGGIGHTLPFLIPDFRSPPRSRSPSCWSSCGRSPGSAPATWTRRSCGGVPGGGRRRPGVRDRHPDRQRLTRRPSATVGRSGPSLGHQREGERQPSLLRPTEQAIFILHQ